MGIRLRLGLALAVTSALILSGCSKSSTSPSATPGTVTVNVVGVLGNQAFQPNPVAVAAGNMVVFKNTTSVTHHIVLDDGSADFGDLTAGATTTGFNVTNSKALTFHCKIHPSMVGSINGQTAPDSPPCSDPYGVNCGM
jgi:plastocyanin